MKESAGDMLALLLRDAVAAHRRAPFGADGFPANFIGKQQVGSVRAGCGVIVRAQQGDGTDNAVTEVAGSICTIAVEPAHQQHVAIRHSGQAAVRGSEAAGPREFEQRVLDARLVVATIT